MSARSSKPDEYKLHRTGIRGRRIYILVAFLVLLALLCVINLIILVIMYSVLDLHSHGMSSMSFMKDDDQFVKFLMDSDFEYLYLDDGTIGGFTDQSIQFHGDNQNLTFLTESATVSSLPQSQDHPHSDHDYKPSARVVIGPNGTFINTQAFRFADPDSRKVVLDIDPFSKLSISGELSGKSMKTNALRTPKVVSNTDADLNLEATGKISITGNEGVYSDGMVTRINGESITFATKDSRSMLVLGGAGGGVKVDRSRMMDTSSSSATVNNVERYRLCGCEADGVLFAVPIDDNLKDATCATIDVNVCA